MENPSTWKTSHRSRYATTRLKLVVALWRMASSDHMQACKSGNHLKLVIQALNFGPLLHDHGTLWHLKDVSPLLNRTYQIGTGSWPFDT